MEFDHRASFRGRVKGDHIKSYCEFADMKTFGHHQLEEARHSSHYSGVEGQPDPNFNGGLA